MKLSKGFVINTKSLILFLLFSQLNQAIAVDKSAVTDANANLFIKEELIPFINNAHKNIYGKIGQQNICLTEPAPTSSGYCPPYLLDMVKENFEGGLEGAIFTSGKAIFGTNTGSIATPDKVCGNTMTTFSPKDFVKTLNESALLHRAPRNILANSNACMANLNDVLLSKNEKTRAQRYLLTAMVHHPTQLEAGFKNMLEAKSQLDLMIGQEKKEDCSKLPTQELKIFCQEVESCKSKNDGAYVKNKAAELTQALEVIKKLKYEKRQLTSLTKEGIEKIKQADLGIKSIEDLYPVIKNPSFKYNMNATNYYMRSIDPISVSTALKSDILNVRKKVNAQLKQLHLAQECISGKRGNCSNFQQVLDEAAPKWKMPVSTPYDTYFSCVETSKVKRDETNSMLNSALATAVLTVTPMGIAATAGSLYKAGKLIKTAATYAKVSKGTVIASAAADTTLSEVEAAKIYGACRSKLDTLVDYNKLAPSCEIIEKRVTLSKDVSACHQQIISGVLSTAFTGMGLGLAKHSLDAAAEVPESMSNLLKQVDDTELDKLYREFSLEMKDPKKRIAVITKLNERLSKIAKSKQYTPEEIKNAMKVILKRCMD